MAGMVIRFRTQRSEVAAATRLISAKSKWTLLICWCVLVAFTLFEAVSAGFRNHQTAAEAWHDAIQPCIILAVTGIFFIALRWGSIVLCARKAILRDVEWDFTDEGVHVRSEVSDSRVAWPAFIKFRENDKVMVLFVQKNLGHFIPKRALTESEVQDLRKLILRHVKAA